MKGNVFDLKEMSFIIVLMIVVIGGLFSIVSDKNPPESHEDPRRIRMIVIESENAFLIDSGKVVETYSRCGDGEFYRFVK